jgi:hypothetical protein
MAEFAVGQYVELYPTLSDELTGGTRGIVQAIDPARDEDMYLVRFLRSERLTGEREWLRAIDLFPA